MKHHTYQKIAYTACAVWLGVAMPAHAATQGLLGATSTGTSSISITKSVQARISDIQDMTLPNWSIGDGAVELSSDICVYSSTGSYKVTATGSGLLNAFTLGSGLNILPYAVTWNSGGAGNLASTGATLLPNIQSLTMANASTASSTCNGGGAGNNTARVIVSIPEIVMNAAASSPTPYTGTLTMLITPF